MEHSVSSEACSRSDGHGITYFVWSRIVNYCVHDSQPQVPVLICIDVVHTLSSYLFETHFKIIL